MIKAISNSKYEHLQGAMEELARLLNEQQGNNAPELQEEIQLKREQLQAMHQSYNEMLRQLELLTFSYEELATDVKMNLLGRLLKEMKKQLTPQSPGYAHFGLSLQLLYGT